VLNPYLERQRLTVVFITIILNVASVLLFSHFPWSDWRTGAALVVVDNLLLLIHVFRMRDLLMLRLMAFGLVIGVAELATDAWLVYTTGTLDYSIGGGPMLWCSPIWMPLAWQIVAVQFGYIGLRLYEAMGVQGLFITGLFGAINIPFYEEMALHVHWWRYENCRMIFHTPWYVILGEFLITMALGRLATCARQRSMGRVFTAGVLGGIVILCSFAVSYLLIDKIWTVMR
jgi:hypothetical protein